MKARLLIALFLSCSVASILADTASVTGVGVYESSGKRAGGVAVGLYATKDKGGHMGDDTTSNNGVFNATTQNVSPSVDELWVCSDSPAHVCDPQPAKLGSPKNGVRTGKTEDLRMISLAESRTFTSKEASEAIGASANTSALKFMAGRFSISQAREWFTGLASRILSRSPGSTSSSERNRIWQGAVQKFNERLPTKEVLEGVTLERLDWKPERNPNRQEL